MVYPYPNPMLLGGVGTSVWNPADKSTNGVLSNGNSTFTSNVANGTYSGVRGARGHSSTGTYYFEVVAGGTLNNTQFSGIGIGNAAASFATFGGADTNSFVYLADGRVFYNNSSAFNATNYAAGSTIGIKYTISNGNIQVYLNGGGTSVITITPLTGTLFPFTTIAQLNASYTLNTGPTATLPSGATIWG